MTSTGPVHNVPDKDNKKIALDKINGNESYFGELCTVLSGLTKKLAGIREKYDELGRVIRNIGDTESGNASLSQGLINYAKVMTLMADVKDLEVQRLQSKVVLELAAYETFCKNQKDALKHSISLHEKEVTRQHQLDQMRQKSHQHNTLEANNSKSKRALQVHKGVADVNELIRRFEMQKIQDIRSVLLNLTAIQLKQHTRAIELLSAAYQEITNIDQIIDAEEFLDKNPINGRSLNPQHRSQSVGALSALQLGAQINRKLGHFSGSTISVNSPRPNSDKELVAYSPPSTNSIKEAENVRSLQSEGNDESETHTEDDSGESSNDAEDSTDNSEISHSRKVPPVPQVRISKLPQIP